MNGIFVQSDFLLLFRLIAAHMVTEWIFRLDFWKHLQRSGKRFLMERLLQGVLAGVLVYLWVGSWKSFWLPLVIFFSRICIAGWKYGKENTILPDIVKQIVYLLILLGCWVVLVSLNIADIITILMSISSNAKLWAIGLAYITVIWPAGAWIGKVTEPWRKELDESIFRGLAKAGLWLGRLERILILTFVLLNHYDAIGFLIAAKSIFRFSEIKSSGDRKEAEYILFGTMLSFVIAIFMGILVIWFFKQLQA